MASTPKPIFVDWTAVKIWCCGEYLNIGDIAEHAEHVHSNGQKVLIDEDKNNENYNVVVNNKKFENSTRKNDKIKDNRKYYCDSCDYITTKKYYLTIHIGNKHLGIRHQCEVCQFRCTTKSGLNRHRKRNHAKTEKKQENGITDMFQNIATEIPSLFQSRLNDALIKQEVVDPMFQGNVDPRSNGNYTRKNVNIKENRKYYCDWCEYITKHKYNLRIHMENKHLGIRHLCEVCQFRCTTKVGLNRHRKRIHAKTEIKQEIGITDTFQKIATETPILFRDGLNDAEIKQEVVDPMFQENVTATLSLSQNGNVNVAETKQEIVSETPTLLANQMVSVAVDVLTEVKEEVDEENLQVPGWRIFPEFEHQLLKERKKALAEGKTEELKNVFLDEQAEIKKLHAKLEKKEKDSKKWDAQWRKRQEDLQKLKAVKDRSSGKKMIKEEEEIEVLWPNPDYVTDLVVYDVGQEPLPPE